MEYPLEIQAGKKGLRRMSPAPPLDVEQRRLGYQRSLELRRARAEIKRRLAQSELSLAEAWQMAEVRTMRVAQLLCALPNVAQKKAARYMREANIPTNNTVGMCGPRQYDKLITLVQQKAPV